MRPVPAILPILLLMSCSSGFEGYTEDLSWTSCQKMEDCGDLETMGWTLEQCAQAYLDLYSSSTCDDFDRAASGSCLDAIQESSCDEYRSGIGLEPCDEVCYNQQAND